MDPIFDTVPASTEQQERIRFIRNEFDTLLKHVEPTMLSSRYSSLVRTKLEEACMLAVKGVLVK